MTLKPMKDNKTIQYLNLNKNVKFEYCNRYDSKDSKPFWVTCKSCYSNKHIKTDIGTMLIENGKWLVLKNNKIDDTYM